MNVSRSPLLIESSPLVFFFPLSSMAFSFAPLPQVCVMKSAVYGRGLKTSEKSVESFRENGVLMASCFRILGKKRQMFEDC